jgi:hypothetical protein
MNSRLKLFRECWLFLNERKKIWMLPMVFILLLLGLLLVFAQTSALSPFIYSLF